MWARLSGQYQLRQPQQDALRRTQQICELIGLADSTTPPVEDYINLLNAELGRTGNEGIQFPFSFPSFCNSIATGVGKTRLMAASIDLIASTTSIRDFIILTPGRTVLQKLISDFDPSSPAWIYRSINKFISNPPTLITAQNYEDVASVSDRSTDNVRIHLLTIQSIQARNREDRRMLNLHENIGASYHDWLRSRDTVCFLDEAHHYRSTNRVNTINSLDCRAGFGMTATPWDNRRRLFSNIVYTYSLTHAIDDGHVRRPVIVTMQGLNIAEHSPDELEDLMLRHGFSTHENTREALTSFSQDTGERRVKPFMLIVCRDIEHAESLRNRIVSEDFRDGYYSERVALVHSGARDTGLENDDNIEELISIEKSTNPIEVVIHVNMLKEGWSVNNLYTIIPLRPGHSRILVEQTIGRGTRLPFGRITGNPDIDAVKVMAHDRFDEIIEAANDIQLTLDVEEAEEINTIEITSTESNVVDEHQEEVRQRISRRLSRRQRIPTGNGDPEQIGSSETEEENDELDDDIQTTVNHLWGNMIRIPRFRRVNSGTQNISLNDTPELDLSNFIIPENTVLLEINIFANGRLTRRRMSAQDTQRINPRIVLAKSLQTIPWIEFSHMRDEIVPLIDAMVSHVTDAHGDDAPAMIAERPRHYCGPIERALLSVREIAQEEENRVETIQYGSVPTLQRTLRHRADVNPIEIQNNPPAEVNIRHVVFTGLQKSIYPQTKFDSIPELIIARYLESDEEVLRWCRPTSDDITIPWGGRTYEPDFVVETRTHKYLLEPKRQDLIDIEEVVLKEQAAHHWVDGANFVESQQEGGKPWRYILIPADRISSTTTLESLWEDNQTRNYPSNESFSEVNL